MAQLVEHIVHIDGVIGSSPIATTTNPCKLYVFEGFSFSSKSKLHDFKDRIIGISIIMVESIKDHFRTMLFSHPSGGCVQTGVFIVGVEQYERAMKKHNVVWLYCWHTVCSDGF